MSGVHPPFDRIFTTHVGSLPRPPRLLELLRARVQGEPYDAAELSDQLSVAVNTVVARQVALGLDLVSDGEFSKPSYVTYVSERLEGFAGDFRGHAARDLRDYQDFARQQVKIGAVVPDAGGARCQGPVAMGSLAPLQADIANLKQAVAASRPVGAFVNAASPGVIAVFQQNDYYPSDEAYVEAVALAMRKEYEAIVAAGFELQIDSPDLAMGRHLAYADMTDAEFVRVIERNVAALNLAVCNIPAERMRLHLCWGNYAGPHHWDIGLKQIIGPVLKAKPTYLLLEGANPRHEHEWCVFRDRALPDDKVLVPGVIDSTSNYIEHPDLVAQRICRYADVVGRERVMAGSDCGFATFSGYPTVHPDIVWGKLQSLVDGADRASERLW